MWNEDDRKWLYEQMREAGVDTGSYDDFSRSLGNEDDRDWYYRKSRSLGLDVGSAEDFAGMMVEPIAAVPRQTGRGVREPSVSGGETAGRMRGAEKASFRGYAGLTDGVDRRLRKQERPLPVLDPNFKPSLDAPTAREMLENAGLRTKVPKMPALNVGRPVVEYDESGKPSAEWEEPVKENDVGSKLFDVGGAVKKRGEEAVQRGIENAVGDRETMIDRQIAEVERRLEDVSKRYEKYDGNWVTQVPLGGVAGVPSLGMTTGNWRKLDAEYVALSQTLDDLKAAKRRLERAKTVKESGGELGGIGHPFTEQGRADWLNNWRNFGYGVWDTLGDPAFYSMGVNELEKAFAYQRMKDKLEKGVPLSEAETDLAIAGVLRAAVEESVSMPVGYKAGVTTAEMAPFMAQMAMNPGQGIGRGLAVQAVRKFGKEGLMAVATRVGGRLLGNVAEAAVLSNTLQAPATVADAMRRYQGDLYRDVDGRVYFDGGEDLLTAAYQAEASSIIENFTELGMGGRFGKWLESGLMKAGSSEVGKKMGLGYVSGLVGKVGSTGFAKGFANFADKTHWDGLVEEPLEEEYGIILNALLRTGDNEIGDLWDSEQQADIFAGTMWFGGFMSGMNTAAYPFAKHRMGKRLDKADTNGVAAFGEDEWAVHKGVIEGMDDKELPKFLYSLKDDADFSNEQKAALFGYAARLKQWQGANVADMLVRMEGNLTSGESVVHGAYERGRDIGGDLTAALPQHAGREANDVKNEYEHQRRRVSELVADDMLAGLDADPVGALNNIRDSEAWTDEDRQIVVDYVNAKATYDGMIGGVQDDIESRVESSNSMIDGRVNGSDGMIHPATMKVDDRKVYVIGGNVVMQEDGAMVDHEKSDESIIIRDAETGKVEFADPRDVLSVDEVLDAGLVKEEAAEAIRQKHAKAAADRIDGVVPFNEGDSYVVTDEEGVQHTVVVVPVGESDGRMVQLGDGEVLVSYDGGEAVPMSRERIQVMVDKTNMARVRQFEQEKAERRAAEAKREASRSVYNLNDEVALQTGEGTVRGTIAAEANEDGLIEVWTESPIGGKKVNLFTREELDGMNADLVAPVNDQVDGEAATMSQQSGQEEGNGYTLSEKKAANGEQFYQDANGNIDLVDIPQVVLDKIGYTKAPLRLTPSMLKHVQLQHGKETGIKNEQDAIAFITDVMGNFDHVRLGNDGALIFSVENGRDKTGKRAITILLNSENGEYYGIKTSGYEAIDRLSKRPLLWEGSAVITPSPDAATESVTSRDAQQGGEQSGSASDQSGLSEGKGSGISDNDQINEEKNADDELVAKLVGMEGKASSRFLKNNVDKLEKDLEKARKKESKATDLDEFERETSAFEAEVKRLEDELERWNGIGKRVRDGRLAEQRETADAARAGKKIGMLGEPLSFREWMMRSLYNGGYKFMWGDSADSRTRGLGSHLGLGRSDDERRKRLWMLASREKGGLYPEEVAERMLDSYAAEMGLDGTGGDRNLTSLDVLDELLDVLSVHDTRSRMGEGAVAAHEAATVSRHSGQEKEYMKDGWAKSVGFTSYEEYESYEGYAESDLSVLDDASLDELQKQIAEEYEEESLSFRQNEQLNIQDNGEGASNEGGTGGSVMVPGEGAAGTGGVGGSVEGQGGSEETGGEVTGNLSEADGELPADDGRGGDGSLAGRQQGDLAQTESLNYQLSDEVDENGLQFVLNSEGNIEFGRIGEETGLTPAPILLSEGVITNPNTNAGYGLIHIEARHGDQIRAAGYNTVLEFIEEVAKNYEVIRKGNDRDGRETYMLQLTDKHNNTLMVELSGDGTYWNINTAGIFKTSYGANRTVVYNRHTTDNQPAGTDEASLSGEQSGTTPSTRMNAPTQRGLSETSAKTEPQQPNNAVSSDSSLSSDGVSGITSEEPNGESPVSENKGSEKSATEQIISGKSAVNQSSSAVQAKIAAAEAETNVEPTDAQKEAGNYKKGHLKLDGFDISIENPRGTTRSGTDADGNSWSVTMNNTYGYIRGTEGVDGDHIDVFLSENPSEGDVFVVDQVNKDGSFDEHKVMYGFPDIESARKAYLSNYSEGWKGLGAITPVSKEEFKKWIDSSHRKTKPFAEYSSVKPLGDTQLGEQPNKPTVKAGEDYVSAAERIARENEVKRTAAHFAEETQEEAAAFDKRVPEMDDAELLAYMQEDGKGDVNKAHHPSVYDEYDYRHGDEQLQSYDDTLVRLNESGTTLEQAEEMLANIQKDVSRLATEDRAMLLGQEEALLEYIAGLEKIRYDRQGNPVDADGNLILEEISSVDELKGEDFSNPTRNVQLPKIPENVDKAIGAGGKPVIIKKNIFEKNARDHKDLKPSQSREILKTALYSPDLYGQNQKVSRPYNYVVISTKGADGRNRLVLLEVNNGKENVEIVHWHYIRDNALETLKRQAEREGGHILILPSDKSEEAGGLSSRTLDLSSAGKVTDLFGNAQGSGKKSSSDGKIDDVGEVLAGARKDMRREIAKSLANVTEAALVEKPFGKVYKKPDLKKAVESGALREKDAIFYEALFSMVNQQKPKVTQSEMRSKRYIPDRKTKAERWAAATFKQMEVLRQFMELDEPGRDAMMERMLADRYPTREQELAEIEKRKGWNPDYEGHKYEWGEMTTPNPLWVTHEVMNLLGYSVGDKLDVPYGVVKANTSGTGYSIENLKGERASLFGSGMTLDEAIDRIVYLAKLKRGDADVSHPTQLFAFPATKSESGESGRYRVMWGRDYKTREFDSKEDADAFAQTKSGAYVSPIIVNDNAKVYQKII